MSQERPEMDLDEYSSQCNLGEYGATSESGTKLAGRWTKEEHQRFVEGLEKFGKNWKKVEDYVGTRTGAQIRSHAQKFFNRLQRDTGGDSNDGKQSVGSQGLERIQTRRKNGELEENRLKTGGVFVLENKGYFDRPLPAASSFGIAMSNKEASTAPQMGKMEPGEPIEARKTLNSHELIYFNQILPNHSSGLSHLRKTASDVNRKRHKKPSSQPTENAATGKIFTVMSLDDSRGNENGIIKIPLLAPTPALGVSAKRCSLSQGGGEKVMISLGQSIINSEPQTTMRLKENQGKASLYAFGASRPVSEEEVFNISQKTQGLVSRNNAGEANLNEIKGISLIAPF